MAAIPSDHVPGDARLEVQALIEEGSIADAQARFESLVWPSPMAPESKIHLLKKLAAALSPEALDAFLTRLYGVLDEDASTSNPALRLRRATAEYNAGFLEQALGTIAKRAPEVELSAAAHSLRSDILSGLGRHAEAVSSARCAYERKPDRADYVLQFAARLIEVDDVDEARAVLSRAVEKNPSDERLLSRISGLRLEPRHIKELYEAAVAVRDRARAVEEPANAEHDGGDVEREVLRKFRDHLADWDGFRLTPDSLVVGRNQSGTAPFLFWCFQGAPEFVALAAALGAHRPLFGMRSGHLIISYRPEEVLAISSRYAREIVEIQPEGPLYVGGNCQGAFIARSVANRLREAGRVVASLFLMEESHFRPYAGAVCLLFGKDSNLNPYKAEADPEPLFREAYPAGFSVDLIDGAHGQFFNDENVRSLANTLESHLSVVGKVGVESLEGRFRS